MLHKLLRHLFARSTSSRHYPAVLQHARHGIDPHYISASARYVCEKLQKSGYRAYIVGGAVRDLVLGLAPKDFDIATEATPEQVCSLFRSCLLYTSPSPRDRQKSRMPSSA